jgi:hypothetical protein
LRKVHSDQKFEGAETKKGRIKQRLKKALASFGACRKKYKCLRKTTEGNSAGEAFQEWMDHVRKKHHEQIDNVRRRKARLQHKVPWDPRGLICKIRSSEVSDHRSTNSSFATTRTLREATFKR